MRIGFALNLTLHGAPSLLIVNLKGEQEVKREGSGREVSDLGGSESVPVSRQGALDSFEELDPLAFDPQDDVLLNLRLN